MYLPYMQSVLVNRDNWAAIAKERGIRFEVIAVQVGLSYSAVYRYATGSRNTPDWFIEKVARLLEEAAA